MEIFKTYPPEVAASREQILSVAKELQDGIARKYAAPDPETATAVEIAQYDAYRALRAMQEEMAIAMEPVYRQLSFMERLASFHVKVEDGEISVSVVDLLEK